MATIMFVDDEAGIRNALKRLFIDSPHNVLVAASAAEALELLRSNTCAVIVSDNQMPGGSGIEFLNKARQLAPDTVRVMMTAYADLGMTAARSASRKPRSIFRGNWTVTR